MRSFLGLALIISLMVMESYATSNDLTCTMCVDIVTDIGNIVICKQNIGNIVIYKTKIVL